MILWINTNINWKEAHFLGMVEFKGHIYAFLEIFLKNLVVSHSVSCTTESGKFFVLVTESANLYPNSQFWDD